VGVGECENGRFKVVLEGGKGRQTEPRKFRLECQPNALNGVEFRGIGREEEEGEVVGKEEFFGMMDFGIVEDHDVEPVRKLSGKTVNKALKGISIEGTGSFKIGFARGGGNDAKEIEPLKVMLA